MTTRKLFTIMLVANLLTVALVTAAFQAGGIVASPAPRPASDEATAFDPNLAPFVPWYMNYQGILKDNSGNPLTGQHNLIFTIYSWNQYISSYENVWTETHNNVPFTNGLFNVRLGTQGSPLYGSVFAGMGENGVWHGDLVLGIRVDGGAELSPRISLGTVPYAHRAEYVNRFPAPHYNSGWQAIAQNQLKTFTHNLGGNVDNYVVDVQFKDAGGVHQAYYGWDHDDLAGDKGAYWGGLTTTSIYVWRAANDLGVVQVRVRIWRIE